MDNSLALMGCQQGVDDTEQEETITNQGYCTHPMALSKNSSLRLGAMDLYLARWSRDRWRDIARERSVRDSRCPVFLLLIDLNIVQFMVGCGASVVCERA